jgi:hypothetical protein
VQVPKDELRVTDVEYHTVGYVGAVETSSGSSSIENYDIGYVGEGVRSDRGVAIGGALTATVPCTKLALDGDDWVTLTSRRAVSLKILETRLGFTVHIA